MPPEFRGIKFWEGRGTGSYVRVRDSISGMLAVEAYQCSARANANVSLDRDQVAELHRRLGHWLAAQPKAPAKWEDL